MRKSHPKSIHSREDKVLNGKQVAGQTGATVVLSAFFHSTMVGELGPSAHLIYIFKIFFIVVQLQLSV